MAKKILVVDDEPDLLKVLLFRLGKIGYEVFGAVDGRQALDLTRKIIPDLIILDVYLPVINGDEVAKILKNDEKLKHIPIFLISATSHSLIQRTADSGANAYFTKPFEPEELIGAVKKVLEENKMNDANSAPKKILVIDDEGDILKMARTRLEANGYKVITLDSGESALATVKSEKPDIILLDIVMPGKSGYDVCKELKADQSTCQIPAIIFTAYYPQEEDVKLRSAISCADDYILKPFESQELLAKIKLLLK